MTYMRRKAAIRISSFSWRASGYLRDGLLWSLFIEEPSTKEPNGSQVLWLRRIPIWTDKLSELTKRIRPSRLSRVQPTVQGPILEHVGQIRHVAESELIARMIRPRHSPHSIENAP
jgi:hypothetical protein